MADSAPGWPAGSSRRNHGGTHSGVHAGPVTVPGADAAAALQLEGTLPPMMYDMDLTVMVTVAGIATVAAVYLWSKDPDRRRRAWRLLKLLLGRP
jgi:hypothetical protein